MVHHAFAVHLHAYKGCNGQFVNKMATACDKETPSHMHVPMVGQACFNSAAECDKRPCDCEENLLCNDAKVHPAESKHVRVEWTQNDEHHQAKQAEQHNTTFRLYPAMAWLLSNV